MTFLRTALFPLFAAILTGAACHAEPSPFLPQYAARIVESASEIEVTNIAAMRYIPSIIGMNDSRYSKKLSAPQRQLLTKALTGAQSINPALRLKVCRFEPGMRITFFMPSTVRDGPQAPVETLTFLLCLNCDLWAAGSGRQNTQFSRNPETIAFYGDSKPLRAELVQLYRTLFPEN